MEFTNVHCVPDVEALRGYAQEPFHGGDQVGVSSIKSKWLRIRQYALPLGGLNASKPS